MVICLERGADLHMAQLMPLPLTVSCFSKIQTFLPFLYWLTWVVPGKGPLNVCACVLPGVRSVRECKGGFVIVSFVFVCVSMTRGLRTRSGTAVDSRCYVICST